MLQDIITYISTLDPALIYVVLCFFAFIENILPPSPSDFVLIVGATLISNSTIGFVPILILTSIASGLGFIVMYLIGEYFGEKILRSGKLKFIKAESLEKADKFFHKYGYKIIIINRFLPGTRAVVSFFSGVHKLKPVPTFTYAALSSLLWNSLLIFLGIQLGNNLELIDKYLKEYSQIIFGILALTALVFLVKFILNKKKINEVI
jgi:membrane protein DedA with SNARE-associated domain